MKFLPLLDEVTSALNFHTPNCRVVGSCDLYTTKAAGSDKKLYRNIENSLESQYESLLRLSASASPPQETINLSRSSPFGSLSQVSNRRTFAYLLATLNASHVDYDFSHILRPTDFRKGTLKAAMSIIDSTLYNLRPATLGMTLQVPSQTSYAVASSTPVTSQWNPSMWSRIDNEMILKDCTVYCWAPPDEPFDGEEGSIWSLHYFFFNKEKKRVAYIYIRGVPVMSHSPGLRSGMPKRSASGYDPGANKRAKYWLGDQAANITTDQDADLDQDDSVWNDDSDTMFDGDEFCDNYDDEADDESDEQEYKGPVRGMSEDIAASMDME